MYIPSVYTRQPQDGVGTPVIIYSLIESQNIYKLLICGLFIEKLKVKGSIWAQDSAKFYML